MQQIDPSMQPVMTDAPQVEPTANDIQSVGSKKSSIVGYLGIALLMLAVGGGSYYFGKQQNVSPTIQEEVPAQPSSSPVAVIASPSPITLDESLEQLSPTANLKSYRSVTGSFTINYPEDLTIEESKGAQNTAVESNLYLKSGATQVADLVVFKKGFLFPVDSQEVRDVSLQEWMIINRYVRSDLPGQKCSEAMYGTLVGLECSLTPYGAAGYYFVSKTDGRFVEARATSEYLSQLKQMLESLKLQ